MKRAITEVHALPASDALTADFGRYRGHVGHNRLALARDFAAGTLIQVLPQWRFATDEGIYLVRPSSQFTPARTEAFIRWITGLFAGGLPWDAAVEAATNSQYP
ncbi:hypothetical protein [Paraburkholderia fynbosensis]|uniref:LysR substrate-binding domain-containing protein n=1 Tax=Paraburkholderia fynbosensis TaxID=1200993 RepID=A0A6J5H4N2_9BURK|nr:hypothetical protein [Paraburkholderia fynbosensis]CAB3810892.1 hypothetical protein LMG27177_07570 [Paraburkholderia fynbosensis]